MSPRATCCWTIAYSASVRWPGLRRIASGMPILPMSWSRPATSIVRISSVRQPDPASDERRVARHVLRVPLRIAVLGVDGDDQTLQDVEAACWPPAVLADSVRGVADGVAAARLGLLQTPRRNGEQRRDRRRVLGIRRESDAHGDGQPLGLVEPEAQVDERGPQTGHDGLEMGHGGRRRDEQELVGSVATELHRRRRHVLASVVGDRQERLVSGGMTVVVVEQPEVVDVDEGDADRPDLSRRPARSPGPGARRARRG